MRGATALVVLLALTLFATPLTRGATANSASSDKSDSDLSSASKESAKADAQKAGLTFPMGAIGGHGFVPYGATEMTVTQLNASAPGAACGLKIGDVIVAANGVKFPPHNQNVGAGGDGPPRVLGDQIEISESRSDGNNAIELTVKRGGTETKVAVKLPRQPALSATWPYDCAKSEAYLDGICRYLAATQNGGHWRTGYGGGADYTTTAWAGLTLLGSGDSKYDENVKQVVEYLRKGGMNGSNWAKFYTGVFLCEYYLATQDESVIPLIKMRVDKLVENQGKEGKEAGRFGHGGATITYDGGGLNIVTSGVMWFWAMARQCGVEVPQEAWDRSMNWLKACTGRGGGVGYSWASDDHQGHGRTSQTLLAAYVADVEPDLRKRWAGWLKNNSKSARENHAFTLPGMGPAFAALAATDPDGFRAYMDEWRWYFTLNRQPDFAADYIPGKENSGGDVYLKQPFISNAVLGYVLCAARKRLYVYGGFPRIPGVRFGDLSPKLRTIYSMIRDKQVRAALNATAPLLDGTGDDAEKAKLLYEFIVGPARTRFAEIVAAFDRRELYEGNLELRNFVDLYGDLPEFRGKTGELNAVFNDPANKQQVEAGRTYHLRLAYLQRTPGAADKVYGEFLEKYGENEPYVGWIKARMGGSTPADSVARLASLVAPEGDDAKAAARLNRVAARSDAIKSLAATLRPQVAPLEVPDESDTTALADTRAKLALRQMDTADRLRTEGKHFDAYRTYGMVATRYDDTPVAEIARQWVIGYETNEPFMKVFTEAERKKEAKRLYDLAESLKQAGHPDVANKQLKMLIELYPESDYARKARRELPAL
ncbi:MAG: hypothetical protein GC159_07455 [Phycisphaera sp.]|nr:hypothetical protein [Phycisphaera sp.]